MNAPLPPDIARFMAAAADEFRAAVSDPPAWWPDQPWTEQSMQDAADEYQRSAIAGAQEPEQGYEVEQTK
jgi:hypothetical protein